MGPVVLEHEATKPGNILGSGRAEVDGEMLDAAFIETSDYKTILEAHDATFVVGRRGTGKSALFIKAKAHFGSNARIVLVTEKPEEHESIELQRVLELYAPDYRLARALCRIAWKIDILLGVIQHSRPIVLGLQQLPQVLQQLLKDHSDILFTTGPLRCAEVIKLLAQGNGPDASLPNRVASAFHMKELQDSVQSLLTESNKTAIAIWDGLDEGWVPTAIATATLAGLAAAISDLAESKTGIRGVLFIRDNMYRSVATSDGDFSRIIEGNTLRLRWDEESLLHFVARRLRVALHLDNADGDVRIWNHFARRGLEGKGGFQKCLDLTLYRPRDIIHLLNSAHGDARRAGRDHIIDNDIEKAAVEISAHRLNDLLKEYETVLPGLRLFVSCFDSRAAIERLSTVVDMLNDTAHSTPFTEGNEREFAVFETGLEIFSALFGVGFIGVKDNNRGSYVFCHDGSTTHVPELKGDLTATVHPCYWRALNLKADDEQGTIVIQIDDEYEDSLGVASESPSEIKVFRTNQLNSIVSDLKNIPTGSEGSGRFEGWVLRGIRIIFAGVLNNIQPKPNAGAVQQRDIVATNTGKGTFWRRVLEDFRSRQIIFEIKNYEQLR
jgi:hypothetical protein